MNTETLAANFKRYADPQKRPGGYGEPIPNSWMLRGYCCRCGCAMRINRMDRFKINICIDCDGSQPHYHIHARRTNNNVDLEQNPWQENAVRALEDNG